MEKVKIMSLRLCSIALIIVMLFSVMSVSVSAVSYPSIFPGSGMGDDYVIPKGEIGELKFSAHNLSDFDGIGYEIKVYDKNGDVVSEAEDTLSTYAMVTDLTITINTKSYDVGTYTVSARSTYYYYGDWYYTPYEPSEFEIKIVNGYIKGADVFRNDIMYTITNASTRTVEYIDNYNNDLTSITVPSEIILNKKDYAVTSVSSKLTLNRRNITSVTIPASVTKIGDIIKWIDSEDIPNFTIKGVKGSAAEKYAKKVGCKFTPIAAKCHVYTNGVCDLCGKWKFNTNTVSIKSVTSHADGVKVEWSKILGAKKYIIYRKTSGGKWTSVGTSTGTSFIDKKAKSNTKYYYTVKGQCGKYYSNYNKSGKAITYMAAPKVTVSNTNTGVYLKWNKISGATTYYVYRKTTGGWTKLTSTKATSFTDKKAKSNVTYTYTVRAGKTGLLSALSTYKKITRLTTPKLTKIATSKGKITITFGKVAGATNYYIYRKTTGGWKKIGTTQAGTFIDKNVKRGTTYTYTVKAIKGSYASAYNKTGLKAKAK